MTLLVALLVLGQVDDIHRPWDSPAKYSTPEAVKALARMELYFQPVHEAPPYRLEGLASYERASMPLPLLLGDLLFHAPKLLGPRAGVFGISCNTCHPAGVSNNELFVQGASDLSGNVDLLSDYFYPAADDGVFAPRNIPSLRGIAATGPYRRDGAVPVLAKVNALVVGVEFQQKIPAGWLAALTDYVLRLGFQRAPSLDAAGRLTDSAPASARAGEVVFEAPRPAFEGKSCASCHPKAQAFTDHLQHPLRHGEGKGTLGRTKRFDTPALLNLKESAPYFFDGSAADVPGAVALLDRRHRLGLSQEDKASLASYLEVIGEVEQPLRAWSPAERVRQAMGWARLVETGGEAVWALCLDTIRHQVRLAASVSEGPAAPLERLASELQALSRKPPTAAARARLAELRREAER